MTTAVLFATAPAGDGGPAAALAWERTTLLGRLLGQLAELGIRDAHVITRPGVGRRARGRARTATASACRLAAVARRAPADLRAVAADRAPRRRAGWSSRTPTSSPRARRSPACSPTRASRPGCSRRRSGEVQRYMAFRTRGRRGRVRQRRVAVPLRPPAQRHVPRRPQGRAGRTARRWPTSPSGSPALVDGAAAGRLARGARRQGRPLEARAPPARAAGARASRDERRAGPEADAPPRTTSRTRARRPTTSSSRPQDDAELRAPARGRRAATCRRCCCAGSCAPTSRSASATCASCSGRRPLTAADVEQAAARDRRARRGPRAARLRREGERRLLHDVLRQPVLEVHRALGRAPRLDPERGHDALGRDRLRRRGGVRDRRARGA